jgi:hypothetical protein
VYNSTNRSESYKSYDVKYDSTSFNVTLDAPLVYEERISTKVFTDYNSHQTIYKLNPLSYGNYSILISNNPAFQDDGLYLHVAESMIIISDQFISASRDADEDEETYKALLIDRKTGSPYKNKKVHLYETSTKVSPKLIQSVNTDEKGEFRYTPDYATDRNDLEDYELFLADENQ